MNAASRGLTPGLCCTTDRLTPRSLHASATRWLRDGRAACLVSVDAIRGSTPRDQDARMLVAPDEVRGTFAAFGSGGLGDKHLARLAGTDIDLRRRNAR